MKMKLSTLRKIIREEWYRNLEWTAGIAAGGAGLNKPQKGIKYGVPPGLGSDAPPGLGLDKDLETENEEETNEEESTSRIERT